MSSRSQHEYFDTTTTTRTSCDDNGKCEITTCKDGVCTTAPAPSTAYSKESTRAETSCKDGKCETITTTCENGVCTTKTVIFDEPPHVPFPSTSSIIPSSAIPLIMANLPLPPSSTSTTISTSTTMSTQKNCEGGTCETITTTCKNGVCNSTSVITKNPDYSVIAAARTTLPVWSQVLIGIASLLAFLFIAWVVYRQVTPTRSSSK